MFVRLTFCRLLPEKINETRRIFVEEIMPTVRKQKGLIDVRFLEPTANTEDYISMTNGRQKKMLTFMKTMVFTENWLTN